MAQTDVIDQDTLIIEDDASSKRSFKRKALLKPPEDKWPAPRIYQWRHNLRELPRENKIMLEDFGITPTTLSGFARRAKQGDKDAVAKLEPVKQVVFELMGMDQHERECWDRNNKPIFVDDPLNPGQKIRKTETRSKWGVRGEGHDMHHMADVGPRPRRAHWKRLVDEHFYDLVTVMEFLKRGIPATQRGRKSPTLEQQVEALKVACDATQDPQRKDSLELIKPFITNNVMSEWDGME